MRVKKKRQSWRVSGGRRDKRARSAGRISVCVSASGPGAQSTPVTPAAGGEHRHRAMVKISFQPVAGQKVEKEADGDKTEILIPHPVVSSLSMSALVFVSFHCNLEPASAAVWLIDLFDQHLSPFIYLFYFIFGWETKKMLFAPLQLGASYWNLQMHAPAFTSLMQMSTSVWCNHYRFNCFMVLQLNKSHTLNGAVIQDKA